MKKLKAVSLVCVLLSFTLLVYFSNKSRVRNEVSDASEPTHAVSPRTPVAKVNEVPITAGELEEELNRILISPAAHGGMNPEKKDRLRKTALEELIIRELAYQKAKAMGLKIDENELLATIKKIRRRFRTEESFQEALKAEGIMEKEFEHRIEKDLLLRKIHRIEIEDKAQVREEDVRKYYEENKAKFVVPESVRLRMIVVKIEANKEAEAKNKIDYIYEKLKAGEGFYDMAYRFSEDDYRVLGGDYGWVHRGQLVPELEKIAFDAKTNELTGPFRTSYGWHIIKVENKQPRRQLKYEEVKEKIKNDLYRKRLNQRRLEFMNGLKATAKIEYPDR